MPRFWLIAGALSMLLALIIAASFGHRPPEGFLPVTLSIFDTAREMHFVHAIALLAVGLTSAHFGRRRLFNYAGVAFLVGTLCFCGGIYLGYGPLPAIRPIIPIGGIAFMTGWLLFALGAYRLGS